MMEASQFIATIENRQGLKIACLEEIAWKQKWISDNTFEKAGYQMQKSCYGQYILDLLKEESNFTTKTISEKTMEEA